MSFALRLTSNSFRPSIHHKKDLDECVGISNHIHIHRVIRVSVPFFSLFPRNNWNFSWTLNHNHHHHRHFLLHSASAGDETAHGISDSQNCSAESEGSMERKDSQQGKSLTTTKILEQLRRYGVSGILSYGLLNTAYYLATFLLVWFYFAPVPGRMGYVAAVTRFLKVMAMVWAGSQVTKLIRAAGALALAPFVDRGLSWFTVRFKFESRGNAFFTIVGLCLGVAFILFIVVTLLWA